MTTPSTIWSSLRRSGYGVLYAFTVEGIPYVFSERQALTYGGASPTVPSGYTFSGALAVTDGTAISSECDRKSGVGSGRAVSLTLSRQRLTSEGLLGVLFARPTKRARVTSDVTNPAATTINVDDTSAWGSSGTLWVGRERITYGGKTGTSFTSCARGTCGLPHVIKSGLASGYVYATDVPVYWRGRIVTIYEHLTTPCGQLMGSALATVGEYCREVWLGFVDAQPQPSAPGFVLRCLPIERLLSQKVGADLTADIVTGDVYPTGEYRGADAVTAYSPIIYAGETDQLVFKASGNSNSSIGPTREMGICSAVSWFAEALKNVDSVTSSHSQAIAFDNAYGGSPVLVCYALGTASTDSVTVASTAWFVEPTVLTIQGGRRLLLPLRLNTCPAWLVVRPSPDALDAATSLPASGYGIIESGDSSELVRWDKTSTNTYGGTEVAIRLSARGLGGTPRLDPWTDGGTFRAITGTFGGFEEVVRTILTSSGTGDRGSFDTLGFGMGLGIPDGRIASFPPYPFSGSYIEAMAGSSDSVESLLGGWLALWRRCMVQRRDADGYIRLFPVETTCTDQSEVADVTVSADDTTNAGTSALELQEAPNCIVLRRGTLGSDGQLIVRDTARVQAEGPRQWELKVPGVNDSLGVRMATDILALSDGQAVFDVPLAPWVEVQVGQLVKCITAHPQAYNWKSGAWSSSSVVGRIIGVECDIFSQTKKVVILTAGQATAPLYLCPSVKVVSVTSSTPLTVRVAVGDGAKFVDGDNVFVYRPGDEATVGADMKIDTIKSYATYDEITFTANLSGVTSTCYVTFRAYATAPARQQSFMFVRSNKDWA